MGIHLSGVVYLVRGAVAQARANLFAVGSHSRTSRSLLLLNITKRLASDAASSETILHSISTFPNYSLRLFSEFILIISFFSMCHMSATFIGIVLSLVSWYEIEAGDSHLRKCRVHRNIAR